MKPWQAGIYMALFLLIGLVYGVLFGYLQWGGCE